MMKLPFFFLLLLPLISGEIKSLKLSYDSRPSIPLERFRFTDTGHVTISVSSASAISAFGSPDLSQFGFFMLPEESTNPVRSLLISNSSLCLLDLNYADRLFTFRDLNHSSSFNRSYDVTSPGAYFLYFQRCVSGSLVSMELRTEMYNVVDGVKDFLSPDLARWPLLYFGFSVAYFTVLSFFVHICVINRESVCRIHLLMGVLVAAKALSLSTEAVGMCYARVTGMMPIGWDVLVYVFYFVGDVMFFAVIALVGVGWPFMKRSFAVGEVGILMVVIPLHVLANMAPVVIGQTGPLDIGWIPWYTLLNVMDMFCIFAVVYPVLQLIVSLKGKPETETDGGKAAAKRLAKLALLQQFFIVVTLYLYLTGFLMSTVRFLEAYKYQWVAYAAEKFASLASFGFVFYIFRPVEKNEYFVLDEAEEQAAEVAIQHEQTEV